MRIIIIGGGIIGLTIARDLYKEGFEVVLVEKERIGRGASWVAGGMLAPQSEGLPVNDFFDFCIESRNMYKSYVESLENDTDMKVDYWESGIFCPAYSEEEAEVLKKNLEEYRKYGLTGGWLDRNEIEDMYKSLGESIVGGVLYPDDSQVDNRLLMLALENYIRRKTMVRLYEGTTAIEIFESKGRFQGVKTDKGLLVGDACIIAAGAWSGEIENIPVFPVKGEMLATDIEPDDVDRVFFGSKAYLIPRKSYTRLVVGATEENVGFKDGNTVKGVLQLLTGLKETLPHMVERNLQEFWYGYRPATPDLEPIICEGRVKNLYYATGHHRNGILLAPITSKLFVDLFKNNIRSRYFDIFSYKRFEEKLNGKTG